MTPEEIENKCIAKQVMLLDKYFGNLEEEAAVERPETIGEYSINLPEMIEAEYRVFLADLWAECAPESMKGTPLILEEQKLRDMMTAKLSEGVDAAYEDATKITLWERITNSNHEDVTYYKGLLRDYTQTLLTIMREDFLEEITGKPIENKAFREI